MCATLLFRRQAWAVSVRDVAAKHLELTNSTISLTKQLPTKLSRVAIRPFASSAPTQVRSTFVATQALQRSFHKKLPLRNEAWRPAVSYLRPFSASTQYLRAAKTPDQEPSKLVKLEDEQKDTVHAARDGFDKTEKASMAAQIDLSRRLSKDGNTKGAGWRDIWRLIKIARPEAKLLGFAFGCLILSSAITMSIPLSIGRILDLATNGSPEGTRLFGFTLNQFYIVLGTLLSFGAAANFGRIVMLRIVGERIVARLRSSLYRKTFAQDAEFFDANRVGDLISRLSSDTIIVGKSITQNLSDGLRALVAGGAGIVAMGMVSFKLASILLIMLPPLAIGATISGRMIRSISKNLQKNLGTLTKIAEERLGNVRTSQAFAGEAQEVGRYNKQIKEIFSLGKKDAVVSASFYSGISFTGNMTILVLLSVGGSMVKNGAISIGDLTSFLLYAVYTGTSMVGVTNFWTELMKGVGAASRLFEMDDHKPKIHATLGVPVKSAQGPIKFSNVNFAYPTRPAVSIFNGLDFEIPSGSNVAIVGPSGGGKSTIGSLLLRYYRPTGGSISINGRDISTMNGKQLRRRIGVVSQEPVLMSGSIAENIAYGKPTATRVEIAAAARQANCQFISDFPDGLDTSVGARGAQLSGGQKQRIAIARALLKEPDILILDEATSALDAESETLVNAALATLLKGHNTTISIAHRISTIKRSDRLIVLGNDGKVAEQGTYKDLSANPDSAFSKLMEWQMSGGEPLADRLPEIEGKLMESDEIADDLMKDATEEEDEGVASDIRVVAERVAERTPGGKSG